MVRYTRGGMSIVFIVLAGMSIISLYHMMQFFYEGLSGHPFDLFVYTNVFIRLWYWWTPSVFLFLISISNFLSIYKKGSIKKAYDEFFEEGE